MSYGYKEPNLNKPYPDTQMSEMHVATDMPQVVPTKAQLDNWFTYHDATPEQLSKYQSIRAAARGLAEAIVINAPQCADRSDAIRKVREAVMVANAAIACGGW